MKKHTILIIITLFLLSCNSIKYVGKNQELLTKNSIVIDSVKYEKKDLDQYILQKPNAKTFGLPLSLFFYNLGNPEGSKDIVEWKKKHPKTFNFTKSIFSEKQSLAFAKSMINFNEWFLKNGQAPIIIDSVKTKKSEKNLKTYFKNNGYFNANIKSVKKKINNSKAEITYSVEKGDPLFIEKTFYSVESTVLNKIYEKHLKQTFIKEKNQFNNENFVKEAERITKLFRNKGAYKFNINSINFMIDTLAFKNKASVTTTIKSKSKTSNEFNIFKINEVNIHTDKIKKNELKQLNSKRYKDLNFKFHNTEKYNPKYLSESIFIKPQQIYSDLLRNLTKQHLKSLKNFQSFSIQYEEVNDSLLNANIFLAPMKKYTLNFETELSRSNIRNYDISAKFSLINRNTFKSAEIFRIDTQGSYFNSTSGPGWELGINTSIDIPRFLIPFGSQKIVPKTMFPRTRIFGGTAIQKNIGLDKQTFNFGIDYTWNFNKKKSLKIELLNTQYIKNLNSSKYLEVYKSEYDKARNIAGSLGYDPDIINSNNSLITFINQTSKNTEVSFKTKKELENILNRYNIITSDFLIPSIAYNFTYNNKENFNDNNFSYFRLRIGNSGNFIGYILNQENERNKNTVFDIPIAQYFKIDTEYKKFWETSTTSVLALRFFGGVILTYNNSDIPFSRSYFAGGSNDIRAWQTYSLGPGSRTPGLEYNIGNFKLLGNLEYRFNILGSIKGALFIDGGNIWDIANQSNNDSPAQLTFLKSLKDIAIGSGFGVRYDLKFLVARLDIGFKTREPYLEKNKWFNNFNLNKAQYNLGINYPF